MRHMGGACRIFIALTASVAAILTAQQSPAAPTVPDALSSAVRASYDSGSYRQAADALEVAIKQNPNDAALYFWLGRCYYELYDFDRSASSWNHAVALNPNRSEYHDWLGRAYGRKADEVSHSNMVSALSLAKRTHREFELAVQLDGKNIDAQRDLIAFMANAPANLGGGEEHALEQIHALSAEDPLEGMLALADLYAAHKKFPQASEEYQRVLKASPDRIAPYFEIADYYRDRNDSDNLTRAVEAAATVAPNDRRLGYYRGVALVLQDKDPETAVNYLRTYIDTVPDNSEIPSHSSAYVYLGKLYENQKQPRMAADQYEAALTLDPRNKSVREALKRLRER